MYDVSGYIKIHSRNGYAKNTPYEVDLTYFGSIMGHKGGGLFGLLSVSHSICVSIIKWQFIRNL